jgi:signal transduction histidine kinase/DNA-binding response OmpR family regulator
MNETTPSVARSGALDFLEGGAAMAELIRSVDWAVTSLGAFEEWPQSLRTAVSICLTSRFPLSIWWGPEYVLLYNDAYRPMLGQAKHPRSMGQPALECWAEVAHIIGPMLDGVRKSGKATWETDQLLPIERNGYLEEAYFTYSYSPIRVESGAIGGVFTVVTETTDTVVGERRLRQLRRLSAIASESRTAEGACLACESAFDPSDVPFSLVYLVEDDGERARLVASSGLSAEQRGPPSVALKNEGDEGWPLAKAASLLVPQIVTDVVARFGALPSGPWASPPHMAIVLPVARPGEAHPFALLVAGVSSARALDQKYRDFFELVADHLATALANASAAEAERKRADALAEIDRVKTRFFANVSHEFRTPITLLLGPLEAAIASPSGSLSGDALAMAHRNTLRLLKLVNALLDFSRIGAGRVEASYEPSDLSALTTDLASAFRSAIERVGIVFEVACPDLPRAVYVDHEMWEKIVFNLLSNALKFTFAGTISVSMRHGDAGVELIVADTGTGISESELPRMFGRFHRIAGARSRTHEGTGIGLALVHELVRLHGGSISITSELGVGTTFTISLPWGSAHLPLAHVVAARPARSTAAGPGPYIDDAVEGLPHDDAGPAPAVHAPADVMRGRILFAEDNVDMRSYVSRLLRERWTVDEVGDGDAALAAALASPPDVVLLDVMMPGLDGFALLEVLRADPRTRDVPVIMLSAHASEEARIEGIGAGADDYIVKPFSARELIARVNLQMTMKFVRAAVNKQRAELYEAFMQAPVPICVLRGPQLVFEMANPLYCKLVGRDSRSVVGLPLLEALPEGTGAGFDELLLGVMTSGLSKTLDDVLVRLDLEGNGVLADTYWSMIYAPLRDADGRIDRVLAVHNHTTDYVRARQNIEVQRGRAENALQAKDEFLAMLGHELRNPLAPILTALQLMRLRREHTQEGLIIERQVNHLVRLVDDLFDVSRIARGQIPLHRASVEMSEIVAASIEIASPLLELRRHTLTVDVPRHVLAVDGDRTRLAQVVSNLLTNAAKYTESGGTIRVAARRDGDWIELSVRDSGIGLTPAMLPRVFDLFTQERQTIDRAQGGLGLGLALVRSLVQLHGGEVAVQSEGLGKGSEFVVRLPAATAQVAPAVSPVAPAAARATGLRVLIVDDNEDAAEMLLGALSELGYSARSAHDGPSALRTAAAFAPQIALLDIGLPVMDGYELARRLRADPIHAAIRLIALTGYGQPSDVNAARDAGFDAHVVKPVDLDRLDAVMRDDPRKSDIRELARKTDAAHG